VGEHAGLARAGAGQDQDRSAAVDHGLQLRRIEVLEEVHDYSILDLGLSIWEIGLYCIYHER
jgi:hypothetical protein